jgi:hypothetical protein
MTLLGLISSAALGALIAAAGPAQAQEPRGSFEASCRDINVQGGLLTANCKDMRGDYHVSSIPYRQCQGDIGNNDGVLNCNGAQAQIGGPGYGGQGPGPGYYGGQSYGDNDRGEAIYPEFARTEDHIRDAIRQGLQEGWIPQDAAHHLFDRLHEIRAHERRAYEVHGADLPHDDRMRIHNDLRDLDHRVDRYRQGH